MRALTYNLTPNSNPNPERKSNYTVIQTSTSTITVTSTGNVLFTIPPNSNLNNSPTKHIVGIMGVGIAAVGPVTCNTLQLHA
jgi:hypothetical protein